MWTGRKFRIAEPNGPVVFETQQAGLHSADMLLIPPDIRHSHPAFGPAAMLFLEPENIEWARFPDYGNDGLVPLPFDHRLRSSLAAPQPATAPRRRPWWTI